MSEAMAAFHDLDAAAPHEIVGPQQVDALAREFDRPLGHLAALGADEV
jgi:hypothetical protein